MVLLDEVSFGWMLILRYLQVMTRKITSYHQRELQLLGDSTSETCGLTKGTVCTQAKWPIGLELISVSVA